MSLRIITMEKHDPGSTWGRNQYAVLNGDRYVGRIFRENTAAAEQWFWGVDSSVRAPRHNFGNAPTREAAMTSFRAAWDALPPVSTPGSGKPI